MLASIEIAKHTLLVGGIILALGTISGLFAPEIDDPGIVGEVGLDDTSNRRGNARNGHLCLKLDWQRTQ